jgi:hypothetical protein
LGRLFDLRTGEGSISVGVKRQWKIQKLAGLPISEETRQQLITDIMRRKRPAITLYAWEINGNVANEAFFTQEEAIHNWYVKNKLWEQESLPKGVLLYEQTVSVDELLKHSKETHIQNIKLRDSQKIHVGISPSELHEDMQRTLQNQG